jgi:hypothetical protein
MSVQLFHQIPDYVSGDFDADDFSFEPKSIACERKGWVDGVLLCELPENVDDEYEGTLVVTLELHDPHGMDEYEVFNPYHNGRLFVLPSGILNDKGACQFREATGDDVEQRIEQRASVLCS